MKPTRQRLSLSKGSFVAVVLTSVALVSAAPAAAARPPTFKEREAITAALPAFVRNTPVECLWLTIRVSSRNSRFAWVGSLYLNAIKPGSRCVRYASNGFFVLKKSPRWRVVFQGSTDPPCSLRIPRDLTSCRP
jgi:hypothetical protein